MSTFTGAWETANNIGNILLRRGILSRKQLDAAAQVHDEEALRGIHVFLGQICIDLGFATMGDVQSALEEQRKVMAPACNEDEVADAFERLNSAVHKAHKTSERLQAVSVSMSDDVNHR